VLTIRGGGTCAVTASQAGNDNYDAATAVERTFSIAKASQTISFAALGAKTLADGPFTVGATASSGLPVSFASATPAVCTVDGSSVTITGAGDCTVTASQAGNTTYNAATPVPQTFAIAKASQSITFAALGAKTFGDPPSRWAPRPARACR
jgi:hypothetical protein